jgi:hypothetical protein
MLDNITPRSAAQKLNPQSSRLYSTKLRTDADASADPGNEATRIAIAAHIQLDTLTRKC